MGGRGSNGKSGGSGGIGKVKPNALKKFHVNTTQQAKEFIKSLNIGDKFNLVNDYSDAEVTKLSDSKKYSFQERGVSYSEDGSYTPYNKTYTLSEGTVLTRIKDAKSIRRYTITGAKANRGK